MNRNQIARILARAATTYGVLTPRDAEALDLHWRAVRELVLDLGGTSLYRGTVQTPGPWDGHLSRCAAAAAAVGAQALVTARNAARCWGISGASDIPVRLLVGPTETCPRLSRVAAWRTSMLSAEDRACVSGIPVAGVNRTLLDMARLAQPAELEEAIAKAVQRDLTSLLALHDYVEAHRRHRAAGVLATALEHLARDGRTDSRLERRIRRWLRDHGFEPAAGTYSLTLGSGRVVRIDIAFPDERVGIEVDGLYWHGTPQQQHADMWRQREIEEAGWVICRVGVRDLGDGGERLARYLADLLQRRRRELGIGSPTRR